jgi:hypothetical protein
MMPQRLLFIAVMFGLIAGSIAQNAGAVLYKWTDENGRTVYGDQPPPGIKPERLNASLGPADPNAVRDMATKDAEIKKRMQQRVDDAAKLEKEQSDAKRRLDQCVQARGRIRTLREDVAVYRFNEKGEKSFYQPADREKAINESQKIIRDLNCPPPPVT